LKWEGKGTGEGKEETYKGRRKERRKERVDTYVERFGSENWFVHLHPLQKSRHRSVFELCKMSASLL
jgi:hypothetical protein